MSPDTITNGSFSTGTTLTIPKLADDGSNWVEFESKARNAMGSKGLIRYIDGTMIEPKTHRIVAGVSVMSMVTTPAVPATPATATAPAIAAVPAVVSDTPVSEAEVEARVVVVDAFWVKEYSARHLQISVDGSRYRSPLHLDMVTLITPTM